MGMILIDKASLIKAIVVNTNANEQKASAIISTVLDKPMNCETCDHKKNAPESLHCNMFEKEPEEICHQPTAFKMLGHEIADDLQAAIARPSFYKLFVKGT